MPSLSSIIIGVMVFSGIMIAMGTFYGDVVTNYHSYNSTEFNSSLIGNFTQFNESYAYIQSKMEQIESKLAPASEKAWYDLTKYSDAIMAFVPVGSIILAIPSLITNFINVGFGMWGIPGVIPTWFKSLLLLIPIVIIVLKVAAYFLKREEM